jgi:hypothetical protein
VGYGCAITSSESERKSTHSHYDLFKQFIRHERKKNTDEFYKFHRLLITQTFIENIFLMENQLHLNDQYIL